MRLLVAVASRSRGTSHLAEVLGDQLSSRGADVDVLRPSAIDGFDQYDAVVVGAALSGGRWRWNARHFVRTHAEALTDRPVWLYSSATRDDDDSPEHVIDIDLGAIIRAIGVHEHRVFDVPSRRALRKLEDADETRSSRGGRARWDAVEDWAQQILDELSTQRAWMSGEVARGGYLPAEPPA